MYRLTACNYDSTADWNDGSCYYAKEGCECVNGQLKAIRIPLSELPYEVEDLISQGINGNGNVESTPGRKWCGDCYSDLPMTVPTKGCKCGDTPVALNYPSGHTTGEPPEGWEYYCDCEGNTPSQRATNAGCKCDNTGNLELKPEFILEDGTLNYQDGYCSCDGSGNGLTSAEEELLDRVACDCTGEVIDKELNCNCLNEDQAPSLLRKVQYFYPNNLEKPGYVQCNADPVKVCLVRRDDAAVINGYYPDPSGAEFGAWWFYPASDYMMNP